MRGAGFSLHESEMPRLLEVLTLRPGKSVADVGTGRGELTVALTAEAGPAGHVFWSDIDPKALDRIVLEPQPPRSET